MKITQNYAQVATSKRWFILTILFQDDVFLNRTTMLVSPNGSNKRMTTLEVLMIHRLKVGVMIDSATTTRTSTVREVIQVVAILGSAYILVLIIMVVGKEAWV